MLLLTVGLIGLVAGLIYIFLTWNFDYWRKRDVRGPKPTPLFGNFPSIFTQKRHMAYDIDEIYCTYKNDEDFVGVFNSRTPQLLITSGPLIRKIFVNDFKNFHDNEMASMVDEKTDFIMANNPFTLTGEEWKERRAEVTVGLTMSRVKTVYPVTKKITSRLIDYIKEHTRVPPKDGLDTKNVCLRFTSDVVTDCVLGLNANSLSEKPTPILDMTQKLFDQSYTLIVYFALVGFFPILKRFYKCRFLPRPCEKFFVNLMENAVVMRRAQAQQPDHQERLDFLNYLLQLQEKKNLSSLQLTAHSMTFLLDGFETTANVMTHTLLLLARHVETQEKLRAEILENLNENGEIDFDTMIELPYLDACIHETIRIFPPAFNSNKSCTEPIEMVNKNGKTLRMNKGDVVVLPLYSVMKDENYYPEPEKFQPERFDEAHGGVKKYREMGAYFGFGEGPRICLGMRFAMVNIKTGLIDILKNFDVRVNAKTRKDNTLDPVYFLSQLNGGVWLDFKPRT